MCCEYQLCKCWVSFPKALTAVMTAQGVSLAHSHMYSLHGHSTVNSLCILCTCYCRPMWITVVACCYYSFGTPKCTPTCSLIPICQRENYEKCVWGLRSVFLALGRFGDYVTQVRRYLVHLLAMLFSSWRKAYGLQRPIEGYNVGDEGYV